MRIHLLPTFALLSIALAALLSTGYFCEWTAVLPGPVVRNRVGTVAIKIDGGRAVLYLRQRTLTPPTMQPSIHWSANWRGHAPDLRRCLWEFDAHRLPLLGTTASWILAGPIWCPLVPCLTLPLIWLRVRRNIHPEPRGFAVERARRAPQ